MHRFITHVIDSCAFIVVSPFYYTDELVESFKAEYKRSGAHGYESHITYLSGLADRYMARDDWPSLLRVCITVYTCSVILIIPVLSK
jgi:hypothetical protein